MPSTTPRRSLRLALLPILAVGLIGLAACGTSATSATSGSTSGAAGPSGAFAACLAENGVTLPSGGPGGTRPNGGTPPTGSAEPTGAPSAGGARSGGAQGGPRAAPPGAEATTWAAAQKACASLAPTPRAGTS